jgi:predicted transcriptional regulator of viral defense system
LIQRLGYLLDLLQLPLADEARGTLAAGVGKSTPYLGRRAKWGIGGEYDSTWRIVDNIPRHELLAEIEVV